ncbi:MAG: hypothetical protein ABI616_12185 [Pseudomonadota bacterium]
MTDLARKAICILAATAAAVLINGAAVTMAKASQVCGDDYGNVMQHHLAQRSGLVSVKVESAK